jgi:hypothetical protein
VLAVLLLVAVALGAVVLGRRRLVGGRGGLLDMVLGLERAGDGDAAVLLVDLELDVLCEAREV